MACNGGLTRRPHDREWAASTWAIKSMGPRSARSRVRAHRARLKRKGRMTPRVTRPFPRTSEAVALADRRPHLRREFAPLQIAQHDHAHAVGIEAGRRQLDHLIVGHAVDRSRDL